MMMMIRMMRFILWCLLLGVSTITNVYCADDDVVADDDYTYAATDDVFSGSLQQVQPCENGKVQVTGISLLCNSPYTFYWGNGAHRNSQVCDYGDKVQIEVAYTVTESLIDGTPIYMLMAASYQDEQLYLGESVLLCEECYTAGDYTFTKKIQFSYLDGSYEQFLPTLEIAFSYADDGSYILGGVNIQCEDDDDAADWTVNNSDTQKLSPFKVVLINYGIFLTTIFAVAGFALFLWYVNRGPREVTTFNKQQGLLDYEDGSGWGYE